MATIRGVHGVIMVTAPEGATTVPMGLARRQGGHEATPDGEGAVTMRLRKRTPITVLDAPDGHDVIIEGRLDVHTVPDIRDALHDVISRGPGELRLHLSGAEIGDATGLGVLVHIHRRASREQRRLLLLDASERTTRLVRGCRLDRLLAPAHARGTVVSLTA